MKTNNIVEIIDLTKTYNINRDNACIALKGINLEVTEGDFVAIMGESGCGKSTLLHIVGAIDHFEKGIVKIAGENIKNCSDSKLSKIRNEGIGIVVQDFALLNEFTVMENVGIPLSFLKKKPRKSKELIKKMLLKVGLLEKQDSRVSELSGGQKQRVAIARALINNPSIIIADEPTGSLDEKTTDEIMSLLFKLNNEGSTIILATHSEHVASYCKRVIRMYDGSFVNTEQQNTCKIN